MTTYVYTRVSSAEQIAGTSLDSQAERGRAAAALRKIGEPVIITDAGVSGSVPLADRPAGGPMFRQLEAGDTVIAVKMDRLFRNTVDALDVADAMTKRGVYLILLDLSIDPVNMGDGMGKFVFTVMASIAEMERGRIAERTATGRAAKRAAGGATSPAPFGYRKEGLGKAAMLYEDPEQQAAIATILKAHDAGMALREIRDLVHVKHPKVRISHMTVGRVVKRAKEQLAAAAMEELL